MSASRSTRGRATRWRPCSAGREEYIARRRRQEDSRRRSEV
jgi:hypothetical protein